MQLKIIPLVSAGVLVMTENSNKERSKLLRVVSWFLWFLFYSILLSWLVIYAVECIYTHDFTGIRLKLAQNFIDGSVGGLIIWPVIILVFILSARLSVKGYLPGTGVKRRQSSLSFRPGIAVGISIVLIFLAFSSLEYYDKKGHKYDYFEAELSLSSNGRIIKENVLGRVGHAFGWEQTLLNIQKEFLSKCNQNQCKIIKRIELPSLTDQQEKMFADQGVKFNYVSIDSKIKGSADIRIYLPSLGDEFNEMACDNFAKATRAKRQNVVVNCVPKAI